MKKFCFTTMIMLLSVTGIGQTKIGGIVMPNVMKAGDEYLKMNGGGIREKMTLDLYIGVLYLREKSSDPDKIIKADEPMGIKMRVISSFVTKENMEEAIRTGFSKSTHDNTSPIQSKIDELINAGFKQDIGVGDIFDLIYLPSKGTTLSKNNTAVLTITGLDFKQALFGIWLCDDPADENLKAKMLGQ